MKRIMSAEWQTYASLIPPGAEQQGRAWLDAIPDEDFDCVEVAPDFELNENGFPIAWSPGLKTLVEKRGAYVAFLRSDDLATTDIAKAYTKRVRAAFELYFRDHPEKVTAI